MQVHLETEFFNEISLLNDPFVIENLKRKYQTYFSEIHYQKNPFDLQISKGNPLYFKICVYKNSSFKKFVALFNPMLFEGKEMKILIYSKCDLEEMDEKKSICFSIEKLFSNEVKNKILNNC